jgi:hypothetical protein
LDSAFIAPRIKLRQVGLHPIAKGQGRPYSVRISHFDLRQVSIIGRDFHTDDHVVGLAA